MFLDAGKHDRILAILCASVAIAGCNSLDNKPNYTAEEQIWIDKALSLYSGDQAGGRERVLEYATPVVVYLKDYVCVAFKVNNSSIGGEFTACFYRADGSVYLTHTEGE